MRAFSRCGTAKDHERRHHYPSRSGTTAPAVSHFGHGILTFHSPRLFRTEPGAELMVQGPINRPKDGIAALSGIIETDWSPYSFTMNWMFTRAGTPVRFEKGEPYCHIFPVQCGRSKRLEPELEVLSADPELKRQHDAWTASRARFNIDLNRPGSEAQSDKWQKLYYRGLAPDSAPAPAETHRTRLRLKIVQDALEFVRLSGRRLAGVISPQSSTKNGLGPYQRWLPPTYAREERHCRKACNMPPALPYLPPIKL